MALAVGIVCGAINGFCIAYFRLPAIIVTLAMMEMPRGAALLYTKGYPLTGLPQRFAAIGRGEIAGVQTPILIMLVLFGIAYVVLQHSRLGRYIYSIGENERASLFSGVPVKPVKLTAYVISGFCAAAAGVVLASRLMSGQPNAGEGFELDAIAAVVLGGSRISGGRGHILGTLIGALTLGVLNNGLNILEISPYTQRVVKGAVILCAVFVNRKRAP
jgi:ribose transport system permease protein